MQRLRARCYHRKLRCTRIPVETFNVSSKLYIRIGKKRRENGASRRPTTLPRKVERPRYHFLRSILLQNARKTGSRSVHPGFADNTENSIPSSEQLDTMEVGTTRVHVWERDSIKRDARRAGTVTPFKAVFMSHTPLKSSANLYHPPTIPSLSMRNRCSERWSISMPKEVIDGPLVDD